MMRRNRKESVLHRALAYTGKGVDISQAAELGELRELYAAMDEDEKQRTINFLKTGGDEGMEFLTVQEAADLLKMSVHVLNKWRVQKTGPEFVKVGKSVRYRRESIEAWVKTRTVETEQR